MPLQENYKRQTKKGAKEKNSKIRKEYSFHNKHIQKKRKAKIMKEEEGEQVVNLFKKKKQNGVIYCQ